MIDLFSLALSHGLLLLAAIKLLRRSDLDQDLPAATYSAAVERPNVGAPPYRA